MFSTTFNKLSQRDDSTESSYRDDSIEWSHPMTLVNKDPYGHEGKSVIWEGVMLHRCNVTPPVQQKRGGKNKPFQSYRGVR